MTLFQLSEAFWHFMMSQGVIARLNKTKAKKVSAEYFEQHYILKKMNAC